MKLVKNLDWDRKRKPGYIKEPTPIYNYDLIGIGEGFILDKATSKEVSNICNNALRFGCRLEVQKNWEGKILFRRAEFPKTHIVENYPILGQLEHDEIKTKEFYHIDYERTLRLRISPSNFTYMDHKNRHDFVNACLKESAQLFQNDDDYRNKYSQLRTFLIDKGIGDMESFKAALEKSRSGETEI